MVDLFINVVKYTFRERYDRVVWDSASKKYHETMKRHLDDPHSDLLPETRAEFVVRVFVRRTSYLSMDYS